MQRPAAPSYKMRTDVARNSYQLSAISFQIEETATMEPSAVSLNKQQQ